MPGYKTHLFGGGVLYLIILLTLIYIFPVINFSIETVLLACLSICVGALFPDIDITSKIQRVIYFLMGLLMIVSLWLNNLKLFFIISACAFVLIIIKHRGITHTWWFGPVLFSIIWAIGGEYRDLITLYGFFFILGYWSHIVLDFYF
jgi:membrane-bound metal-dependent hydrolase YbcI (DUF457 family)